MSLLTTSRLPSTNPSVETRNGDFALADARGIAGLKRVYGDLSCAIIFEPQPVQMLGAEGEAAKPDRLLPTGHR
jgi:hypothetical protein